MSVTYLGHRVAYERHGRLATGTVVRETIFSWALKASSVTILDDETGFLVGLPIFGFFKRIPGADPAAELEHASYRYQDILRSNPVWAARFTAGAWPAEKLF